MHCDWCDGTRWALLDEEQEVGFIYGPCPKCSWLPRAQPPIPAPVGSLKFVSNRRRIRLGEDAAWRQHELDSRAQM